MFRLQIPRSKFVGFFYFFRQMSRMTCREPKFLVKMSWKQLTPTRKVENTGCFSHMWFTMVQPQKLVHFPTIEIDTIGVAVRLVHISMIEINTIGANTYINEYGTNVRDSTYDDQTNSVDF